MFDAMQVKLPKIRDPQRPAWNFPQIYGIVDKRRKQNAKKGTVYEFGNKKIRK